MRRTLTVAGVVAVVAAMSVTAFAVQASSASSKKHAVAASSVVHRDVISLAAAQKLATAAQADCEKRGFAVSAAVVDTDGVDILVQRADGTTGATVAVARGKARAAAGFQSPTGPGSGSRRRRRIRGSSRSPISSSCRAGSRSWSARRSSAVSA